MDTSTSDTYNKGLILSEHLSVSRLALAIYVDVAKKGGLLVTRAWCLPQSYPPPFTWNAIKPVVQPYY